MDIKINDSIKCKIYVKPVEDEVVELGKSMARVKEVVELEYEAKKYREALEKLSSEYPVSYREDEKVPDELRKILEKL